MIKKYALTLLLFSFSTGFTFAQMAMPEMSIRRNDDRKARHVPAQTWNTNPPATSAESARIPTENPGNFTMQLSPNPTGDAARLELYLPQAGRLHIALVGRDGKLIRSVYDARRVKSGHWSNTIHLNGIPAGIYYLRLRVGEEFHSLPLVKL